MFNSGSAACRSAVRGVLFAFGLTAASGIALGQQVPRSFVASPDVYKVVAQNDEYLIIEVTWKPGQRDQLHSHAKALSYWITDCNARFYTQEGKVTDATRTAGRAGGQGPVAAHYVENIGKSDCKLIMFEPK